MFRKTPHYAPVQAMMRARVASERITMDTNHTTQGSVTAEPPAEGRGPLVAVPLMMVADLQDSLLVAMHDLRRLERLLTEATDKLMERFDTAHDTLDAALHDGNPVGQAVVALREAVTELQFQDMASQLIGHTTHVLQGCASQLAAEAMGAEEGEEALSPVVEPRRSNPVAQGGMEPGSVELF